MRNVTVAVLAVLCASGAAQAALDTTFAYNDGETIWADVTPMYAEKPGDPNHVLSVNVEWCVDWLPGSVYGIDSFIYKYQITVQPGSAELSQFSVGMLESNEATNIGWNILDPADVEPVYAEIIGGNAANWIIPSALAGQATAQLTYTSVNSPLMWNGTVVNLGVYAYGDVPSPSQLIPEPMTLVILAGGAAMALRRRR